MFKGLRKLVSFWEVLETFFEKREKFWESQISFLKKFPIFEFICNKIIILKIELNAKGTPIFTEEPKEKSDAKKILKELWIRIKGN